jgi:nucleotide-binding universal stress UspA family protein
MRNILLAVDGSDCAVRAVQSALQFATELKHPVRFHVVCAVPAPGTWDLLPNGSEEDLEAQFRLAGEHAIAPAAIVLKQAQAAYDVHLVKEDPAQEIARLAAELDCDLIVMGTHGRGRIAGLVMGSVAMKVVHLSTVPVTLVK